MTGWNDSLKTVKNSPDDIGSADETTTETGSERLQAARVMALINAINEAANRGDSLHEIFKILTTNTAKLFAGIGATVYLLSGDSQYLDVQHFELSDSLLSKIECMLGLKLQNLRIPLKQGSLYRKYLEEKTPRIITDERSIGAFLAELAQGELEKKLLLLPSIVQTLAETESDNAGKSDL